MLGRTHTAIGFASLISAAVYFPQKDITLATAIMAITANTVGSMLPDIDQGSNKLWGMLPFGNSAGSVLSKLFLSHRSITHSLLGVYLVDKAVFYFLPKIFNGNYIDYNVVAISLMIGFIAHLAADGLTEEGLPLLFPLKIKFGLPPIKSWRIKTGHWFEKLVITPAIILYILWFSTSNWERLIR